MKRRTIIWSLLLLLLATVPTAVWANGQSEIAQVRAATAKYHRLEVAEADGFVQLFGCIQHPTEGAMGVHFIKPDRFDDQLDLLEPEALVYDFEPNGKAKLVAVEYIIPGAAWSGPEAPEFLGQVLKYKQTVGLHPVDPYYEVHVWAWRQNPNGLFADWNPRVTCSSPD